MLYHDRIDLSAGIDPVKSSNSKECIVCHYWFFNHGFEFQNSDCNDFHFLTMLCLHFSDIAIITVKGVDYRCIIHDISKSEAIHLLENSNSKMIKGIYIKCLSMKSINIKGRVYNYSSPTYGIM